ncbi:serine/threonine-protein kinase [Permianibacter aggregans]|uniref:non-specific serine/threonine protein kinase n=1 Tax=Permianibacter aggregans TaxID=1510150 RepID=A0A4R6UV59_9GAMM|nr:serine/threonine-protein kinase [Permianibacter aggregans]QGX40545.1 serine/threonine protein kinase [Permianibacter aggregans]TDQ49305.1 serine/threonine-protein kinase [Permianibacter aggregans]
MRALWQRLLPLLDLRMLVWVGGMWLILFTPSSGSLRQFDRALFSVGAQLMPAPITPDAIEVLALTQPELQQLMQDPVAHADTTALLYSLLNSKAQIAFITPLLPRTEAFSAEQLLRDAGEQSLVYQAFQSREALRQKFAQWLHSPSVRVASNTLTPRLGSEQRVLVEPNGERDFNALLGRKIGKYSAPTQYVQSIPSNNRLAIWPASLPGASHDSIKQPLLWHHDEQWYPSLDLAMLQPSDNGSHLNWQAPNFLQRLPDGQVYPINADGSIYPLLQPDAAYTPNIVQHDMRSFVRSGGVTPYLFIGLADDPALLQLAGNVQSLQSGYYYHSPWWFPALEKAVLLLVLLYTLLLVPRVHPGVSLLIGAMLLGLIVVGQFGTQLTQAQWLPLGLTMQFLLFSSAIMLLWRQQQKPITLLREQHLQMALQWSNHLVQQGQLDQALQALNACPPSKPVLELMYEIGGQHERKRRPAAAVEVYKALLQRKPRYKDVAKRIAQLEQKQTTQIVEPTSLALTKTMVLDDQHGRPQFGRYQIESELGRGAMGVVYLGFDPHIARKVAIKTLDYAQYDASEREAVKARFFREAEAAGKLRHPNIVSVYDVGEDHDLAFIAMDYITGQPLSDFVGKSNLLPVSEVFAIVADVADALHYAHEQQVVHRDIKPGNIMYDRAQKKVTVTDFGIARIVSEQRTQTGEIVGSPLYMSPEQIVGKKVSKPTDIFSLGVTLYQLLSGELPFQGENIAVLSHQIMNGKHKPIRDARSGLPSAASRIINKALQKDPYERYQNAAEMAKALRNAI